MTTEKITLGYSESKFLFNSQKDYSTIPNIRKFRGSGGESFWGFSDLYPQSAVTIQFLKDSTAQLNASGEAAKRARHILSIPDLITSTDFLDQNADILKTSPMAHQVPAITRMLYYDRLALIFEQGLGKTYIALMWLALKQRMLGRRVRALIVSPKIVAPNWIREAAKHSQLNGVLLLGSAGAKDLAKEQIASGDWDFISTTYDVIGKGKGDKKKMRATKDAKIDYWLSLSPGARRSLTLGAVRNEVLSQEDASRIITCTAETKKERNILWNDLKKISKVLTGTEVVKHQDKYSDFEFLKSVDYDAVIFDEAARIKNHKSNRTQASFELCQNKQYIYHLSGTLCNGSPADMFSPFKLLNSALWESYKDFEKKYIVYSSYNKHAITGYKNLDNLKLRIDPYKFEAKRDDCIDLPERIMMPVETFMNSNLIDLYNAIASKEVTTIRVNGYIINVGSSVVKIGKLCQLCNGTLFPTMTEEYYSHCNTCDNILRCVEADIMPWSDKCPFRKEHGLMKPPKMKPLILGDSKLEALAEDLQASEEKTIIWAWYTADLSRIKNLLTSMGIQYITPETPNCDAIFEARSDIRVFLGQTAQGIGITLNSATRMIYYSHGTALEPRLQSLERNYRIGQKSKTLVRDYVDPNTIENNILHLLDHKVDVKDFMQRNVECITCSNSLDCLAREIKPYTKGCIFFEDKVNAEKKVNLGVPQYGFNSCNAQSDDSNDWGSGGAIPEFEFTELS